VVRKNSAFEIARAKGNDVKLSVLVYVYVIMDHALHKQRAKSHSFVALSFVLSVVIEALVNLCQ